MSIHPSLPYFINPSFTFLTPTTSLGTSIYSCCTTPSITPLPTLYPFTFLQHHSTHLFLAASLHPSFSLQQRAQT